MFAYPVRISAEAEDFGRFHAYFRDFPEAIASGANFEEALAEAEGALAAVARMRLKRRSLLPTPSPLLQGEQLVYLPATLAAKAVVIGSLVASRLSIAGFAERMDVHETEARRIVDPDHATKLDRLEAAARALGSRMIIEAI
ncbi:MAG: hypothetical protein JNM13_06495 [Hyphomicrobiaceae bacterium]|nr:hypothetical protein [Hyphomicrobiaceae bacterium]